jgi:ribosomal protein S18
MRFVCKFPDTFFRFKKKNLDFFLSEENKILQRQISGITFQWASS